MSDTNSTSSNNGNENLDDIEEKEDEREEAQLDDSLDEEGLLPVPKATPADGEAPAA
ncbi:MAG: hypothetical protein JWR01_885 [Subtercola sp.]|nr:hypothetical protein [Subtercola sp.]